MSEWPTVKLGEVAEQTNRRVGELDVPIYSVTKYDGFVPSSEYFKKRVFSMDIRKYKLCTAGDFAYATIHLDEGSIGISPVKCGISPMYTTFRLNSLNISPDYLLRYLKSSRALTQYLTLGSGSAERRKSIKFTDLRKMEIPFPPLGEQKRIAEILGGVSKAIQKTKVQLLLVDILKENKYLSLSKDADTFKSLKDLGVKKITGKSIVAKPDNEHGINQIIKVSAVSSGRFIASETKPLPADYEPNNLHEIHQGDLLFARASGSANLLGACCIVDKEIQHLYLPDKVWKLEVDEDILPKVYLLQALRGREFRSVAESHFSSSTGVKNIKTSVLMEFKIPVLKKDQLNDYVHFVKTLDNLRHLLHRKLSLLQELQKSLATRAFAGLL